MKIKQVQNLAQAGFTLVELIVVMVILGVLAAVAIPRLAGSTDAARNGVQDATLGALKSAWSIAFAQNRIAPTHTQVAQAMDDPRCAATTDGITCTGVTGTNGTGAAVFGVNDAAGRALAAGIPTPANIVIINRQGTFPE